MKTSSPEVDPIASRGCGAVALTLSSGRSLISKEEPYMHKATIVQFEITGADSQALQRFYRLLFGWQLRDTPTPGYRLTSARRAKLSAPAIAACQSRRS